MEPSNANGYFNLGVVSADLGDMAAAEAAFRNAHKLRLDWIDPVCGLAGIHERMGEPEQAIAVLEPALERGQTAINLLLVASRCYRQLGRTNAALEVMSRGLSAEEVRPGQEAAWFVYGELLHDTGDFAAAFRAFKTGNDMLARRADSTTGIPVQQICELYDDKLQRVLPCSKNDSDRPIFIVGMPRSGTSLVEQILGQHPLVAAGGELTLIDDLLQTLPERVAACGYKVGLDQVTSETMTGMATDYLQATQHLAGGHRYLTDKMPGNFMHLGAICRLFPRVRVVHVVRNPLDVCFSCYTQPFSVGHGYATDLTALGRYFVDYTKLMQHWRNWLGSQLIEVSYERVVSNPQVEIPSLLARLQLPWHEGCLAPESSKRTVQTASYAQVRHSIHTRSIGRANHYLKWLTPLQDELQRGGIAVHS